jgi:DNA recombination protein RmuC
MDAGIIIVIALFALAAGAGIAFAFIRRSGEGTQFAAQLGEIAGRLTALDQRLDENMKGSASVIGGLHARLTVIDEAQKKITDLSTQVVTLREILSDKQSRGLYGQGNMEQIVRDALPVGIYDFQATLSNRNRPDCIIRLPNTKASIVIDSKFPLEGFTALKTATGESGRREAMARVRTDVLKHVKDIAEKYLIAGETQDPAIMFVPSESIYAELHENFSDVIQQAHRSRVVVVSPSILMLAVNTICTVLKDARMREQANLIQREVGLLLNDVRIMAERAEKMQRHLGQAEEDVRGILTSTDRIARRAENIGRVELPDREGDEKSRLAQPERRVN